MKGLIVAGLAVTAIILIIALIVCLGNELLDNEQTIAIAALSALVAFVAVIMATTNIPGARPAALAVFSAAILAILLAAGKVTAFIIAAVAIVFISFLSTLSAAVLLSFLIITIVNFGIIYILPKFI